MTHASTRTPAELLLAARSGEAGAWGELLDRYRPYLIILAEVQVGRLLRGKVDPDDLVQEALLQAHQKFATFRGTSEGEFTTWLREILASRFTHLVRHYFCTQKRNVWLERELCAELGRSSQRLAESLVAPGSSPSNGAARREEAVRLATALTELTPEHREVLVLRHIEGLSFPEVSERMCRSLGAVNKLWGRAVRRLGEVLAEDAHGG